jgi:hypothetical protein
VTARAVLAGPGARRALAAGGEGRLKVALGTGGYVRLGEAGWLLVSTPRAPVGPLSLLVAGLGAEPALPGWPARRRGSRLEVGPYAIDLNGLPPARGPEPLGAAAVDAAPALAAALDAGPEPPDVLRPGIEALAAGDLAGAVARLAGRGEGLTPAGDDVLAGYAAWAWAAGRPLALTPLAVGRSSPLGLAYLDCAERGELADAAAGVLAAVRTGRRAVAARRARALGGWGGSSGWALLWGVAAAVRSVRRAAAPSAARPPHADGHTDRDEEQGHEERRGDLDHDPEHHERHDHAHRHHGDQGEHVHLEPPSVSRSLSVP